MALSLPCRLYKDGKLWLALLHELDLAGGSVKPDDLYDPVRRGHFPEITDDDAKLRYPKSDELIWRNQVQFARNELVKLGRMGGPKGTWSLTTQGKQWHDENCEKCRGNQPTAHPASGAQPAPQGEKPRKPRGKNPKRPPAPTIPLDTLSGASSPLAPAPTRSVQLNDAVEVLIQRLETSQSQSQRGAHAQFEKDLVDAFRWLGFAVQHIGGSGETDVSLRAGLGQGSSGAIYSVVVDAKSTEHPKVEDAAIRWDAILEHQTRQEATYAAVVGKGFSGDAVGRNARDHRVTLITTAMLFDLLRRHAEAPFSLLELEELFKPLDLPKGKTESELASHLKSLLEARLKSLLARGEQRQRHWKLVGDVLRTAAQDLHAKLDVSHLTGVLRERARADKRPKTEWPDEDDVRAAVAFLASRAIGVLDEVPPSSGAYRLTMTAETARCRLEAIARALGQCAAPEQSDRPHQTK